MIELVSERVCDDLDAVLAAPGGAALDLARARVRLHRAAWEACDSPFSLDEITALGAGLPAGVGLDMSSLPPAAVFTPRQGRLVLNLLLLAAGSLPNGGAVTLAGSAEDLFVRISGPGAAWPAGLGACCANETAAAAAMTDRPALQMGFTALLAHGFCIRLSLVLPPAGQDRPAILRLGGR
jgi:hypothetical protein